MISGLAQVMAIKPILRSFFSGVALSWAIASSAPNGKKEDTAARAAEEPTAWRKRRRVSSLGKSARITADSITRRLSVSASSERGSSTIASSCSAWLACLPPTAMRRYGNNTSGSAAEGAENGAIVAAGSIGLDPVLRQRPVRRVVEGPRRPAHRAPCDSTGLRKCILREAPDLDRHIEHCLEALRGLESRRIAALHAGRQRSKRVPPEQCSHDLPFGWEL